MRRVIVEVRDFDPDRRRERQMITSRFEVSEKRLEECLKEDDQVLNRIYEQCAFNVDAELGHEKTGCPELEQEAQNEA